MEKIRKIDMSRYKPFSNMGTSCKVREIKEKKIVWVDAIREHDDDARFITRVLEKKDIHKVAELWRASYPEIYGSPHEWLLFPEEYEGKVALKDNWEHDSVHKIYVMLICEEVQTGNLAFANMLTKFDYNLQIEASFFAIHPDYREGKGGLNVWAELSDFYKWMEATGAEYVTVFLETWHNITQYIWFKRMGWKIAGIFPGNFTRWSGEQNECRGCTVHMYRLLNDGEKFTTKPEEWQLLPEVKELWDFMEQVNANADDSGL